MPHGTELTGTDKADEQRQAATEAADLLAERLGPDLARFADLFDRASFGFRAALFALISDPPVVAGMPVVVGVEPILPDPVDPPVAEVLISGEIPAIRELPPEPPLKPADAETGAAARSIVPDVAEEAADLVLGGDPEPDLVVDTIPDDPKP